MRGIVFLFLFLSQSAFADFTFSLKNDGANTEATDVQVDLGVTVGLDLCNNPGLTALSSMQESGQNSACSNYINGADRGVELSIPLRAKFTSTAGEIGVVTFYKASSGHDFQVFDLKDSRNQVNGGGGDLFNQTVQFNNNDELLYELDLRAVISGPDAHSTYTNDIVVDVAPL